MWRIIQLLLIFQILITLFTLQPTKSLSSMSSLSTQQHQLRKELPEKILLAYTTNKCHDTDVMSKVTESIINNGVNVVIWCFISFKTTVAENNDEDATAATTNKCNNPGKPKLQIKTDLNVQNYRRYRKQLQLQHNQNDIIHLAAFGGWNGPHLPSGYTATELYEAFHHFNKVHDHDEYLFDGIDWDLEGHDNQASPTNEFTLECLDQMGEFSALLKQNGFIVSMAPPQSYLDISSQRFSRHVNLPYPNNHPEFKYHGWNVYAYILAKWNTSIDFIFLQFYESYSHASYAVYNERKDASDFLIGYCNTLANGGPSTVSCDEGDPMMDGSMYVDFENDPSVQLSNQRISFPLSKLVWGFANGWALNEDLARKVLFVNEGSIRRAYRELCTTNRRPRGFGFWVIEEEGTNGIAYAKELNAILNDNL